MADLISGITANATPTATTDKSIFSADLNMFIKMLTTQLQNQDPLDPMDTSEYTQQLVQYSQVEQAMQQTSTLKDVLAKLNAQDMTQASAFIGHEVQMDSDVGGLKGTEPVKWSYNVLGIPSSIEAVIKDKAGQVVRSFTVEANALGDVVWDGKKTDGTQAADGAYTLTLNALDSRGVALNSGVASVGKVSEVVSADGETLLGVGGLHFPMSMLQTVRAG
jgi:flagellar basal-body rod modification protein FlgD